MIGLPFVVLGIICIFTPVLEGDRMNKWMWMAVGAYLAVGGSLAYSLGQLTHPTAPLISKIVMHVLVTVFWLPGIFVAFLVRGN